MGEGGVGAGVGQGRGQGGDKEQAKEGLRIRKDIIKKVLGFGIRLRWELSYLHLDGLFKCLDYFNVLLTVQEVEANWTETSATAGL